MIALLSTLVVASSVTVVGIAAASGRQESAVKKPAAVQVAKQKVLDVIPVQTDSLPVHTLGTITNLKKTSKKTDSVTLTWDKAFGATGYYVYACDKDSSDTFEKVAEVTEPTVTVSKLKPGTQYWFRVAPFSRQGEMVYEGKGVEKKTATQPDAVTGLDVERSSKVLGLSWKPKENADGYYIYRACRKSKNKFELVGTIEDPKTTYFEDDKVEEGEPYLYSVCAYRKLYGKAVYTGEGGKLRIISGLSSPGELIATSKASRAMLSWNDNKYAEGFNIYRSDSKDGKFTYVDSTTSNYFTTDKLTPDATYYFRIQPYTKEYGEETTGTWSTCAVKINKEAPQEVKSDGSKSSASAKTSSGGTYIEISIDQQHMWYFENGELILDTDVVTGNADGECDTPTGRFSVDSRATDTTLTGPGYSSFVNYWMGFYGGCGIHDASWRSSFGGSIYQGNGSHGCVNTPYEKVKLLYERTDYGTPVIIY